MADIKHHRVYRELDDEVKKKIQASTINKPKSETHKLHLSQSLKAYWRSVPHRPSSGEEHTTMNDFLKGA